MQESLHQEFELVSENPLSHLVGCISWESDVPGIGADNEKIYRLNDQYFYVSSSWEEFGPYTSLLETLEQNDLFRITSATVGISFPELPAEQIATLLMPAELEQGHRLKINDTTWIYESGGWRLT